MRTITRPRIGPCHDPLHLWFLEWEGKHTVWRRYFANRDEARQVLKAHRELQYLAVASAASRSNHK